MPELWLIVPGKDPRAVGVIDAKKPVALVIPAARLMADATTQAAPCHLAGAARRLAHRPADRPGDRRGQAHEALWEARSCIREAAALRSSSVPPPFGDHANRATELRHATHQQDHPRRLCRRLRSACTENSAFANPGTKMVGGAPMYPSKNIIQNAVNSKAHTTLVAAVKAAGLVKTLEGPGPFTVFAPTNSAFSHLPKGTVPTLLKPENKEKLTQVLTYHVVPGRLTESKLHAMIKEGHGKAELKTVEGGDLTATRSHGHYYITDAKGDRARITIGDVLQSNGVIHVINKVMLPG